VQNFRSSPAYASPEGFLIRQFVSEFKEQASEFNDQPFGSIASNYHIEEYFTRPDHSECGSIKRAYVLFSEARLATVATLFAKLHRISYTVPQVLTSICTHKKSMCGPYRLRSSWISEHPRAESSISVYV